MIDWKRLFLPTLEKVIVLIIIFYLFGIYFPKIATCNDCVFVKLGIPYSFYLIGSGDYQSKFSFGYLILDLALLYVLLSLAFYHKFVKTEKTDSDLKKLIFGISNLFISLVIFVILFYTYLVFTEDILNLDEFFNYR